MDEKTASILDKLPKDSLSVMLQAKMEGNAGMFKEEAFACLEEDLITEAEFDYLIEGKRSMNVKIGLLQLIVNDLELAYDAVAEHVQERYCSCSDNDEEVYISLADLADSVTLDLDEEEEEQEIKEALHRLIL